MENVLDLYKRPYNSEYPVINLDETSKQLVGEVKTVIPMKPGQPMKYDCEYRRNETQQFTA